MILINTIYKEYLNKYNNLFAWTRDLIIIIIFHVIIFIIIVIIIIIIEYMSLKIFNCFNTNMNISWWYAIIILCRKSQIKQFSIMKVWWDFLVLVRDTFVFWLPPSSNSHITYKHSRPETIKKIIKTNVVIEIITFWPQAVPD